MGVFDWFKHVAAGRANDQARPADDHGAEIGGLNFMAAIDVHVKWRSRLESHIQGTNKEAIDADEVGRDDACALGKWIYGIGGERYGALDTFAEIKAQHAHFHTCARKVLCTAQEGRKQEALHMLTHGDYLRASERVKMLLAKLYVQIAETGK